MNDAGELLRQCAGPLSLTAYFKVQPNCANNTDSIHSAMLEETRVFFCGQCFDEVLWHLFDFDGTSVEHINTSYLLTFAVVNNTRLFELFQVIHGQSFRYFPKRLEECHDDQEAGNTRDQTEEEEQ